MSSLKAEFVVSCSQAGAVSRRSGLPEVAFLGRSNVGKSSLINALTGQKELAFTSSTPGRTQTINFYRVDERLLFRRSSGVWIRPGPQGISRAVEEADRAVFARTERPWSFPVLILDARRGWMEKDLELKRWLEHPRQAVPGGRHQDRQVESIRARAAESARHPQGRRGAAAVLGRHRPGSEGNLASDHRKHSTHGSNDLPQEQSEKPTEKTPTRESAPPESSKSRREAADKTSGRAEKPHRPSAPASRRRRGHAAGSQGRRRQGRRGQTSRTEACAGAEAAAEPAASLRPRQRRRRPQHLRPRSRPPEPPGWTPTSARSAANRAPRKPPRAALPRSTWSSSRT